MPQSAIRIEVSGHVALRVATANPHAKQHGVVQGHCLLPHGRWSNCRPRVLSLCPALVVFHLQELGVEYFCSNLVTTAEHLRTTKEAWKSRRGQQGGI